MIKCKGTIFAIWVLSNDRIEYEPDINDDYWRQLILWKIDLNEWIWYSPSSSKLTQYNNIGGLFSSQIIS